MLSNADLAQTATITARNVTSGNQSAIITLIRNTGKAASTVDRLLSNAIASYSDKHHEEGTLKGWHGFELSNGGFYLAPPDDGTAYKMVCATNNYDGSMSSDAAGIVACLVAFSQIACHTEHDDHIMLFQNLRDYARDHAEAPAIMAAID